MKTSLHFLKYRLAYLINMLIIFFTISTQAYAQIPQYYNFNTAGTPNSFPFNQAAGKLTQWLYHSGEFNQPSAAPSGAIVSLALRINETYPLNSTTYSNFTIRLGQSSITTFSTGNFYNGFLDTVYYKHRLLFLARAANG